MKKTNKLALHRTDIITLTPSRLARVAGGRWNEGGPSEEPCGTQGTYCQSNPCDGPTTGNTASCYTTGSNHCPFPF
jgi:hypothetical protein